MRYEDLYRRSIEQPEAFWAEAATAIEWREPPGAILEYTNPPFRRWFAGGTTNLCHNAVDRHLTRARRPAGAGGGVHRDRRHPRDHLSRPAPRGERVRRRAEEARRWPRRPRGHLPAEHGRGGIRDAGLRPHRRDPLGGVRRLRRAQPRTAHRRCKATTADRRRRRQPRWQGHPVQAAGRPGLRGGEVPAAEGAAGVARARPGAAARGGSRRGLRRVARAGRGRACRERERSRGVAGIQRAQLPALHLWHHRQAQGRAARCRRPCGGAGAVDAHGLRRRPGPGDVLHVRRRLGGGPFVQRVRAATGWRDLAALRGPAGEPGPGHLVVAVRALRRAHHVLLAHRRTRAEEARRLAHPRPRPVEAALPVPYRRAAGRADRAVDHDRAGKAGHRQLLADRDRLAGAVPAAGRGHETGEVRFAGPAQPRLQAAGHRRDHRPRLPLPGRRACW